MTKRCAYLTMEDPEGFFVYDQLTYEPLAALGWEVTEVPWSAPQRPWSDFDAVVVRSPWDYQKTPQRFLKTLESIEAAGVRLFNSADVCRWNMDKVYLRELQEAGVPLVPTRWLTRLAPADLDSAFKEVGEKVVVKPTIGANADYAFVLHADRPAGWQAALDHYANSPLMLQPFVDSINTRGEYSLFYFGGHYSHAILKRPKAGDFRVQEEHGGVIEPVAAADQLLSVGEQVIAAVKEDLLYARVDLIFLDEATPVLMELELIEPSLYFSYDDQSPARFAAALDEMAGNVVARADRRN